MEDVPTGKELKKRLGAIHDRVVKARARGATNPKELEAALKEEADVLRLVSPGIRELCTRKASSRRVPNGAGGTPSHVRIVSGGSPTLGKKR